MSLNQVIYSISRPLGGLQFAKFLTRKHPRILMYHRVHDGSRQEGISVETLRWQLSLIKENFCPMPLDEMISAYENHTLPDNAVALTFDDGYRDFYDFAYPVLSELKLPSTLFVTTGFVSGELWLWPDQVRFLIQNTTKDWINIEEFHAPIATEAEKNAAWNGIGDLCLSLQNDEKFKLIGELSDCLGVALPIEAPRGFEGLTWDMIRQMIRSSNLSIGSHSVSHPIMTKLNPQDLDHELLASKSKIEREVGLDVSAFCYPNGQKNDFNEDTESAVIAADYKYALVAFPSVSPMESLWSISRYAASSERDIFEKEIYGFTYLGSKLRQG